MGANAVSEAKRQVKNLTILIWFLYVLGTTKHFVALIGLADSKRKTLHQRYVISLDLVFALHTLVKCSGSNEHGKNHSS